MPPDWPTSLADNIEYGRLEGELRISAKPAKEDNPIAKQTIQPSTEA